MRPRIMYIEEKDPSSVGGTDGGQARIGRVRFSKTGKTVYYNGQTFHRHNGAYGNHVDAKTGTQYWITGPKRGGGNRNYSNLPIEIDEDVREEYWVKIREMPENKRDKLARF